MRYFIILAYKGTNYKGWQRQTSTNQTIQQILEDTFEKMTGKKSSIIGCGRTDAGVHADQYFAHIDYDEVWNYDPKERMNKMLPNDIVVYNFLPVHDRAHARYDAIDRTYEYHIHLECNPFLSEVSGHYVIPDPDFEAIEKALSLIRQQKDFRYLCLTPDKYNSTICTIYGASIEASEDGKRLCFRFTANRFLKSMIRMIVARLIEIARKKLQIQEFEDILSGKKSIEYNRLANPQGLHLVGVKYPYLED